MYNIYFILIVSFFVTTFLFDKFVDYLNTKNWSDKLPTEAKDIYSQEEYTKSQNYEKTKYKFGVISGIFNFILNLGFLVFWIYWLLDKFLRIYIESNFLLTLIYFWIFFIFQTIVSLPFSYYSTFIIEEKFGFNKMTKKIFFTDLIKNIFLTIFIWWGILSIVLRSYQILWNNFWIVAWGIMSAFSIFFMMFYSTLIVPLFNKQAPLEEWSLKEKINNFAKKIWYKIENIYVIDWSKRSTKANAYFSGLGKSKRIVLFDTLIKDLEEDEIVGVLAHEIWHFTKKHTRQMLIFSLIQSFVILYIFSLFVWNIEISQALWGEINSFHLWSIAFWILFSPISLVLGIFGNILSRKNEYEADEFAKINHDWKYLISALKKLSKNNLSNLKPHKFYEFVHYSHPTVLKRIDKLK